MSRKATLRCVDGPYVGQTFAFPLSALYRSSGGGNAVDLVWIIYGADRHCYSIERNRYGFRLVYRDTF